MAGPSDGAPRTPSSSGRSPSSAFRPACPRPPPCSTPHAAPRRLRTPAWSASSTSGPMVGCDMSSSSPVTASPWPTSSPRAPCLRTRSAGSSARCPSSSNEPVCSACTTRCSRPATCCVAPPAGSRSGGWPSRQRCSSSRSQTPRSPHVAMPRPWWLSRMPPSPPDGRFALRSATPSRDWTPPPGSSGGSPRPRSWPPGCPRTSTSSPGSPCARAPAPRRPETWPTRSPRGPSSRSTWSTPRARDPASGCLRRR